MTKVSDIYNKRINELIESSNKVGSLRDLEKLFGQFTLAILDDLQNGKIKKDEADRVFSLIDEEGLALNNPNQFEGSKAMEEILFEGQIIHDLGTKHGADLKMMKKIAGELTK